MRRPAITLLIAWTALSAHPNRRPSVTAVTDLGVRLI
jgi:hypothetical protein